MKQDRQGARTIQDLERKYQFNRQFSEVMGVAKDAKSDATRAKTKLNKYDDFIVEQGTKDDWVYRKWNSGVMECWKTVTHVTKVNNSWNSMYVGNAVQRQNYPFSFNGKPVEIVTLTSGGSMGIIYPEQNGYGVNGASASAMYNVACLSIITTDATFYFNYHVIGKWR